jgi:hypothetical protein
MPNIVTNYYIQQQLLSPRWRNSKVRKSIWLLENIWSSILILAGIKLLHIMHIIDQNQGF